MNIGMATRSTPSHLQKGEGRREVSQPSDQGRSSCAAGQVRGTLGAHYVKPLYPAPFEMGVLLDPAGGDTAYAGA